MYADIVVKVWVIGQTEEVFLDYEKYLNRYVNYLGRQEQVRVGLMYPAWTFTIR